MSKRTPKMPKNPGGKPPGKGKMPWPPGKKC